MLINLICKECGKVISINRVSKLKEFRNDMSCCKECIQALYEEYYKQEEVL